MVLPVLIYYTSFYTLVCNFNYVNNTSDMKYVPVQYSLSLEKCIQNNSIYVMFNSVTKLSKRQMGMNLMNLISASSMSTLQIEFLYVKLILLTFYRRCDMSKHTATLLLRLFKVFIKIFYFTNCNIIFVRCNRQSSTVRFFIFVVVCFTFSMNQDFFPICIDIPEPSVEEA